MIIENYHTCIQVNPSTTLFHSSKKCQTITPDNLYKIITPIGIFPQNRCYFGNVETLADVEDKHFAFLSSCNKRIILDRLHAGIKSAKNRGEMADV